jgi:hypothetical protein
VLALLVTYQRGSSLTLVLLVHNHSPPSLFSTIRAFVTISMCKARSQCSAGGSKARIYNANEGGATHTGITEILEEASWTQSQNHCGATVCKIRTNHTCERFPYDIRRMNSIIPVCHKNCQAHNEKRAHESDAPPSEQATPSNPNYNDASVYQMR